MRGCHIRGSDAAMRAQCVGVDAFRADRNADRFGAGQLENSPRGAVAGVLDRDPAAAAGDRAGDQIERMPDAGRDEDVGRVACDAAILAEIVGDPRAQRLGALRGQRAERGVRRFGQANADVPLPGSHRQQARIGQPRDERHAGADRTVRFGRALARERVGRLAARMGRGLRRMPRRRQVGVGDDGAHARARAVRAGDVAFRAEAVERGFHRAARDAPSSGERSGGRQRAAARQQLAQDRVAQRVADAVLFRLRAANGQAGRARQVERDRGFSSRHSGLFNIRTSGSSAYTTLRLDSGLR